jgi:hypothetical protein
MSLNNDVRMNIVNELVDSLKNVELIQCFNNTHISINGLRIPIKREKGLISLNFDLSVMEQIDNLIDRTIKAYKQKNYRHGQKEIDYKVIVLGNMNQWLLDNGYTYLHNSKVNGNKLTPIHEKTNMSFVCIGEYKYKRPFSIYHKPLIEGDKVTDNAIICIEGIDYPIEKMGYCNGHYYMKHYSMIRLIEKSIKPRDKKLNLYLKYKGFDSWTAKYSFWMHELKSINTVIAKNDKDDSGKNHRENLT